MEDTCKKDCALWKKYKKNCPNHLETWWTEDVTKKKSLIAHCAPKSTLIMLERLHNAINGLNNAQMKQKEASGNLFKYLGAMVEKAVQISTDRKAQLGGPQ